MLSIHTHAHQVDGLSFPEPSGNDSTASEIPSELVALQYFSMTFMITSLLGVIFTLILYA
ncbi:hypothetical protein [Edwardsiella tarda]|uniref:Uncharacterized protein n=1 Tax=Edwardsiella tarda ATCC 15947 = NBRC 105688 TaxID=667121 RepID=A0AC61THY3_EDWTA|nr:hypothetical protein [Edwardsiella tarda]UAL56660.1 hypothetical protein K8O98_01385 [Edwardsiella tarda]UCQ00286.1 hypothetical protein DCL27_00285 [Edwardsiella tarda ATCC 15947 = NBRC 105688]